MRRTIASYSWFFLAALAVAQAHEDRQEHGAHEHGVAHLDVVVEGSAVHLGLNIPAVNLVGFEHDPGDDLERATLEQAIADLKQGSALMAFTPAAQCTQKRVLVQSDLHSHKHDAEHDEADEHDHEHADIRAFWEIACARVDVLREIDLQGLFQRFPGTQRLRAQAVLPGGQTAAELTPSAAKLKL